MGFAILRTQKLKSVVAVRRSMKHAFREQDTPNADQSRLQDNTHIGARSADEGLAKVGALLPAKRRSDAVLCVEYLVTASPEAMAGKSREEQDAYLRDALEWIKKRHGAANVVYAGIHRDETTPHLYAYAVPLDPDTGRLNAKRWLGGSRALSEMQTEFAKTVGRGHGLQRGIEGSKARHTRVTEWYAQVERVVPAPSVNVPKSRTFENSEKYGDRVAESVMDQLRPKWKELSAKARTADTDRKRADEAIKTAAALQLKAGVLLDALSGLSKADQDRAVKAFFDVTKDAKKARAIEKQTGLNRSVPAKSKPDGLDR